MTQGTARKRKILFVEDSQQDYVLLTHYLKKAQLEFDSVQLSTLEALEQALKEPWDIVLSDFHLGGFTGFDVLKLVQAKAPELSVIIVSGAISEEDAADLMRIGAKDFVRKDNHARLLPAISRELKEREERFARRAAEAELEANKELTAKILESTKDSIYLLGPNGVFVTDSLNENRGLSLSGLSSPVGAPFEALWTRPEDKKQAAHALARALKGGVGKFVARHDISIVTLNWWHVVLTPIQNQRNEIERVLVVARDVSDEKKSEVELTKKASELNRALAQAESANNMKSAFLANMSHEIRTPVGAMMGFSDLLVEDSVTPAEKLEFHGVIRRNGETLIRLLNEVLDLSKIEAGHLEIEIREFKLETVVIDLLSDGKRRATEKGLDLIVESNLDQQLKIRSDETRLKQIVSNLVGNAVKFTERGSVIVKLTLERSGDDEFLKISVEDTGIGIVDEDQAKLFVPFSQADSSMTRRFGGTGLGLALSKRLAVALGGDVQIVRSVRGQGSEFVATIKNAQEQTEPELETEVNDVAVRAHALKGLCILVAEDSVDNQVLLKRALTKSGAEVDFASNGLEAIEKARLVRHDLLLMDLQMPILDGMSATKVLRETGYKKPIIAITAHAMNANRLECLENGFNEHVAKPLDFKALVSVILQTLKVSKELAPGLSRH